MRRLVLDVHDDGSWLVKLSGFKGSENLALVHQAALDALGELSWELLVQHPMMVIERPSDWSTHKYCDEKSYEKHKKERAP